MDLIFDHQNEQYVTLDYKTSHMSHGYICGKSKKNTLYGSKKLLSKDQVP